MSEWNKKVLRHWTGMNEEFFFWNRTRVGNALQFGYNEDAQEIDKYGNPIDGSSLPFCCFPNCGCDGARNCMAESGANFASNVLNPGR